MALSLIQTSSTSAGDFLRSGKAASWDCSWFIIGMEKRERLLKKKIALRIGPWGGSYGIRERKTVSCKQQIMKTLSNNYRNESYWSGKVADKLCASGCCIWLQWQSIQKGQAGRHSFVIAIPSLWMEKWHVSNCRVLENDLTGRLLMHALLWLLSALSENFWRYHLG